MTSKSNAPPEIERSGEEWFEKVSFPLWQKHLLPLAPFQSILQIGIFAGDSFFWAADNLLAEDGEQVGVDPWIPSRQWASQVEWMANAQKLAYERMSAAIAKSKKMLTFVEMKSEWYLLQSCAQERGQFDFIYIDGCHFGPEALTDMVLGWRLLKPGGVMAVDDASLYRGKRLTRGALVGEALDAFVTCYGHKMSVLYSVKDQVGFVKLPFKE